MRRLLPHKALVFLALVIWLISNWSGAHGHLCFDGQEPPMTVHMDMLGDHPEHGIDEKHVDVDLEVGQCVLAKLINIDLPLLIATALLLVLLFKSSRIFIVFYSRLFSSRLVGLRPPLRAPPVFPA